MPKYRKRSKLIPYDNGLLPLGTFPRALLMDKKCSRCKQRKMWWEYRKRSGDRSREIRSVCVVCERDIAAEKRASDPEYYRQLARNASARNPEIYRARAERYRKRHPDRVKAYSREFQSRNVRRWREKNGPGVERARRRARLRSAFHREARKNPELITWLNVVDHDPCSYCGRSVESWDHIVPVSAGGDSIWENITGACASCNSSKGKKPLLIFLLKRNAETMSGDSFVRNKSGR